MTDKIQVPDWKLERYRIGELPAQEMDRVRTAVDSDPSIRRRLEELQLSSEDILKSYPPEWMGCQIRSRAQSAVPSRRPASPPSIRFGSIPKLATVAVALVVVLLIFYPRQSEKNAMEEAQFKGSGPTLVLYRKLPSGAERLAEGSVAFPGDTIQVGYWGVDGHYGVILSLDGRGVVTLHLPEQGPRSVALKAGRLVLLDSAWQLDDAPRWECFYFVTSENAFSVDPILQSARSLAGSETAPEKLPLPESFSQSVFILKKASKP